MTGNKNMICCRHRKEHRVLKIFRSLIGVAGALTCVGAAPAIAASANQDDGKIQRAAGKANATGYPSRPVRVIVPFPPGAGADLVARMIGQKLNEQLKQTFVIDNRSGAAGVIGGNIVANAARDGYTILLVTATFAISAAYSKDLPYDSVRDFAPIALAATGPLVLVVHPAVPARSVKELIELARASPGKLNYASGGAGGINHLSGEMFKSLTGTRIVEVPYKGGGPALNGLLAGEVELMIATLGSCLTQIRAGKLRALGMGTTRRSALWPELATVAESGVPGYEANTWYGFLAPRDTPKAVVSQLNTEIAASIAGEDARARLAVLGFEPPAAYGPAEFAAYLRSEIARWDRVMKKAGINPG